MISSSETTTEETQKKFIFNKVKYQFLAALCGNYPLNICIF